MEIIVFTSIIVVFALYFFIDNIKTKITNGKTDHNELVKVRSEYYKIKKELESELDEKNKYIEELKKDTIELSNCIKDKDNLFEKLKNKNNETHEYISSLMSDYLTLQFDYSNKYLRKKKRPAFVEAKRINELKKITKNAINRLKLLEYKYEYLLQLFPELDLYFDGFENIQELKKIKSLDNFEENYDNTKYYLNEDEYRQLPAEQRDQLALDRYLNGKKSKWQIGRDYELFIGFEYSKDDWEVEYFGIDKKLEDMGRDLIAKKGMEIHIVQCKYWSKEKLIHEKHIYQLFGSAVHYKLSKTRDFKIIPVFVTNIQLSNKAKTAAKYLNVKYREEKELGNFPRIKCNINTVVSKIISG